MYRGRAPRRLGAPTLVTVFLAGRLRFAAWSADWPPEIAAALDFAFAALRFAGFFAAADRVVFPLAGGLMGLAHGNILGAFLPAAGCSDAAANKSAETGALAASEAATTGCFAGAARDGEMFVPYIVRAPRGINALDRCRR